MIKGLKNLIKKKRGGHLGQPHHAGHNFDLYNI